MNVENKIGFIFSSLMFFLSGAKFGMLEFGGGYIYLGFGIIFSYFAWRTDE